MSTPSSDFTPRWASPPGRTIATALRERGLTTDQFREATSMSPELVDAILSGTERISIDSARRLSSFIGGSVNFWIARDGQYHEDLARVEADGWANQLPIADMVSFGWIDRPKDWIDRLESALRFFDVQDVSSWQAHYLNPITSARLRASAAHPPTREALAVWLRRAETDSAQLKCATWDRSLFHGLLSDARKLTTLKDPRRFLPQLQDLCARAGVAVVAIRPPKGCNVSGAARFLDSGRGMIALTARYLTDDHLWFTFFHEAAHLLDGDGDGIYVDDLSLDTRGERAMTERAADEFAATALLTASGLAELPTVEPNVRELIRLANRLGIAPGIIVGQLQYSGRLGFGSGLNGLKRRYRWSGTTLEMR